MAPFKFIDRVSRGVTLQQFGDGSSSRDYTYIDDIADGVVRSIDRPYPYQVFNLGKGSGANLKDFLGLVEKHVGKKAKIELLPDQPGDVPYTCANVRKAEHLLGYKSKVPFEEGIRRTVEWYKKTYPFVEEEDGEEESYGSEEYDEDEEESPAKREWGAPDAATLSGLIGDPEGGGSWVLPLIYLQWILVAWFALHRVWRNRQSHPSNHSE